MKPSNCLVFLLNGLVQALDHLGFNGLELTNFVFLVLLLFAITFAHVEVVVVDVL